LKFSFQIIVITERQERQMNRPNKIRKVYKELRHSLGGEIPSQEVLKHAASLVDIFDDRDHAPLIHLHTQRATFDELPLDEAFADGGWRVMRRESNWMNDIYSDEPSDPRVANKLKSLTMEMAA
jgi:hypothetical protein